MWENDAAKKLTKKLPPESLRKSQNCTKKGLTFHAGDVPKIIKIHKFAKMNSRDVPGSKRHPKSVQKVSKRCLKGVQKASKVIQIRPHWNKNSKIPMQRTAENHAPYQSFSSELKSQHMQSRPQLASGLFTFVSVLLSAMQAFSMSTSHAGVQV